MKTSRIFTQCSVTSPINTIFFLLFLSFGCGWRAGYPVLDGLRIGDVKGVVVDQSVISSMRSALALQVERTGAVAGKGVPVNLYLTVEESGQASNASGTVIRHVSLKGRASVASRPGCAVYAAVDAPYVVSENGAAADQVRAEKLQALVDPLAVRLVDRLVLESKCR